MEFPAKRWQMLLQMLPLLLPRKLMWLLNKPPFLKQLLLPQKLKPPLKRRLLPKPLKRTQMPLPLPTLRPVMLVRAMQAMQATVVEVMGAEAETAVEVVATADTPKAA